MKTPFCAAVRIAGAAVDEVRLAIAEAQEELACLQGREAAANAALRSERALGSGAAGLPATRWFERQAQLGAELQQRRAVVEALLAGLRNEATDRLGRLKALEGAAERFRAAERRRRARREQAEADDRAAALFRQAGQAA